MALRHASTHLPGLSNTVTGTPQPGFPPVPQEQGLRHYCRSRFRVAQPPNNFAYVPSVGSGRRSRLLRSNGITSTSPRRTGRALLEASGAQQQTGWQARHGNARALPVDGNGSDGSGLHAPRLQAIKATATNAVTRLPGAVREAGITPASNLHCRTARQQLSGGRTLYIWNIIMRNLAMRDHNVKSVACAPDVPAGPPPQSERPPLRVPRSKSAAMVLIQQLAARGHGYWTRGEIRTDRLPHFVYKMDAKFRVCEPAKSRTRMRAKGVPTGHLILYQQLHTDRWLWWCLLAGKSGTVARVADAYGERFYSVHDRRTVLTWGAEYELGRGPRDTMTWWLCRKAANDVEGELRYLASAHGRPDERVDDLRRAVARARARPMFSGVRQQVGRALARSQHRWQKTHKHQPWPADTGKLPWMRAGIRLYDDPPEVVTLAWP